MSDDQYDLNCLVLEKVFEEPNPQHRTSILTGIMLGVTATGGNKELYEAAHLLRTQTWNSIFGKQL